MLLKRELIEISKLLAELDNVNKKLDIAKLGLTKVIELDHGTPSKICKVTIEEINK